MATRFAPTSSIIDAEPDEQAFEIVLAGLLDLGAVDGDVVEDQFLPS